jgi:hypothetical protein
MVSQLEHLCKILAVNRLKYKVPQLLANFKIIAVQGNFLLTMSSMEYITKGDKNAYKNFSFYSFSLCAHLERLWIGRGTTRQPHIKR